MSITLNFEAADGQMLAHAVKQFAGAMVREFREADVVAAAETAVVQAVGPEGAAVTSEEPKKPRGRTKAPAAEAVIEQPPANDDGAAVMLTVDDARERMRAVGKQPGGMDAVTKALDHFGVKKISDIDPESGSKPSVKLALYVAKVEELLAAMPGAESA